MNQANPLFFPSSRCKVGKATGLEKHRGTAWCPKSSKKISTFPNETGAARTVRGSAAPRYSWHQEGNGTESGLGAEQCKSTSHPRIKSSHSPRAERLGDVWYWPCAHRWHGALRLLHRCEQQQGAKQQQYAVVALGAGVLSTSCFHTQGVLPHCKKLQSFRKLPLWGRWCWPFHYTQQKVFSHLWLWNESCF